MASNGEGLVDGVGRCEQMEVSRMNPNPEGILVLGEEQTDNGLPSSINILHDYVMEHLLSFLPMADLKNCRLVNRSWNHASNRVILKKDHYIDFSIPIRWDERGPRQENCLIEDIPELLKLISTSDHFPWTKFKVDTRIIKTNEDKHQIVNLFHVVSSFATEIFIFCLQEDLFPENTEYPALRKFSLNQVSSKGRTESKMNSLLRLLENAPALNDLSLEGPSQELKFTNLFAIPNCRNVSRLTLSWWIEDRDLVTLSEMDLRLKYLQISFRPHVNVAGESVRTLLQSQSTCLEELELRRDFVFRFTSRGQRREPLSLTELECPCMNKLKVLTVRSAYMFLGVSYKNQFPALKKLVFDIVDSSRDPLENFFNEEVEPVETLEELVFTSWDYGVEIVLEAARQFPSLRKIRVGASREVLYCLGHSMQHLEEICLIDSANLYEDLDGILTGFSDDDLDPIKSLPSSKLDVLERNVEPMPFLKNLKKLRLDEVPISDFGCRFALLKMEHLQVLELVGTYGQISDQVMKRMREKFVVRMEN